MWLIFALLAPAFYAVAEIFDNFLDNKEFKHPMTLVFYSFLFNIIFIPILFTYQKPIIPSFVNSWLLLIGVGFVGFGYLYPYYQGLKTDDTSVAISFFAIERIFVPVLAFLIVGEVLEIQQYVGIAIVIISVVLLGIHHSRKKFKFSKAVWYIGLAALLLAFEGVFMKLLFDQGLNVSAAIGAESIIGTIFAMSLMFSSKIRKDVILSWPVFVKMSPLFLLEETLTFLGQFSESSAISLTSVSVVKGITMASPFFLILYAWAGRGFFPRLFKEDLHRKNVFKKLLLFAMLIIGIILIKE